MADFADTCRAVLALELDGPLPAQSRTLPTEAAALLVDQVAADLLRLVPGVERLGLALGGCLLDAAQIVRPGWPVHAALARLYRSEPRTRGAAQLMGFGTAGGRMADPVLEPDPALGAGYLLLLPWLLTGEPVDVRAASERLENDLDEHGLAGAGVALALAQSLGITVRHARHLTLADLCAVTALQLEHARLDAAWPLLELALFAPNQVLAVSAASGQSWHHRDGAVRAGVLGYAAWRAAFAHDASPEACAAGYVAWQLEQRRTAALLAAHGLPVAFVDSGSQRGVALGDAVALAEPFLLEALAPDAAGEHALLAHVDPELGVIALSAARREGERWIAFARAYPLGESLDPALRALAAASGLPATITRRVAFAAQPRDRAQLVLQ